MKRHVLMVEQMSVGQIKSQEENRPHVRYRKSGFANERQRGRMEGLESRVWVDVQHQKESTEVAEGFWVMCPALSECCVSIIPTYNKAFKLTPRSER